MRQNLCSILKFVYRQLLVLSKIVEQAILHLRGGGTGGGESYSLRWPIRGGSARKGYPFRLQVYERIGIPLVEVLERVAKSVIWVCERAQ